MKNFSMILAVAAAFFVVSCSNVDDNLLSQLETQKNTLGTMVTSYDSTGKKIAQLVNVMDAAPENFKGTSRFVDAYQFNAGISSKWQATVATVSDLQQKAETLMADYKAGKIKTEDVQKELEVININVTSLQDLFGRISKRVSESQNEYDKMAGEYAANPSSFQMFTGSTMTQASPVPDRGALAPNGQKIMAINPAAGGLSPAAGAAGPPDSSPKPGGLSSGAPSGDKKQTPSGTITGGQQKKQ